MSEYWDDDLDDVGCSNGKTVNVSWNSKELKRQDMPDEEELWDAEPSNTRSGRIVNNSSYYDGNRSSSSATRARNQNWRDKSDNNQRYSDQNRGSQNRYRESRNWRDDKDIEIEIDSNMVGRVIGRGGAKIRELEGESGARIKVMKNDDYSDKSVIRLIGSSDAQEKAQKLIEELTSDFQKFNCHDFNKPSGNKETETPGNTESDSSPLIDWDKLYERSEEIRKKKLAALPPLKKDFYYEDPSVAAMSPTEVAEFRAVNNSISVVKTNDKDQRPIPNPVRTFAEAFQHYPELLEELRKQGFRSPSPIQCQAWPIIMKGYDMIGIAQTGTGKTIAFLFPALIHIMGQPTPREKRVGPSCLIMAPTRELAQQIEMEAKKYSYHNIKSVCLYGGGNRRDQIKMVNKGIDIIIATPGRLNDLVSIKVVDVTGVTYLVLDEADRMLDLGFEPQIRKILLDVRPDRQTIMTSATWTTDVQEMAARYMTDPFKVNVGALNLAAVHTVTQHIIFAGDEDRRELLEEFLANMEPDDKVIVFVERKSIADDLSSDLILKGIECQSIHGDREQCDREQALDDLKTGFVRILIATDVASRGLDICDITHIFNMYFPRNIEEYVHRVGRTGRAGKSGVAISIVTPQDWMHAEELIKILEEADQFVPPDLVSMAQRYRAWKRKKDAEDAACGGRRFRGHRGSRRF